MEKEFELEVILSVTTGISFVDDFDKVFELFWFVYDNNFIPTTGLMILRDDLKNHLLKIHPELKDIECVKTSDREEVQKWLNDQKRKFGNYLTVSLMGKPLNVNEHKNKMDVLVTSCSRPIIISNEEAEQILKQKVAPEMLKRTKEKSEKFEENCLQGINDMQSSLTMMAVPKNHPYVFYGEENDLKEMDFEKRQEIEESARKFRKVNIRNGFEELDSQHKSKGSLVKKLK